MPALPAVPFVMKLVIEGTTPVDPWANTTYWGYTGGPPTAGDMNTICAHLQGLYNANFTALRSNASTYEQIVGFDLSSALGATGGASASTVGTRGAGEVPGSAAVVVSKSVSRRYRGGHGRSYIFAGIQTDLLTASTWTTSLTAAVDGAYAAITSGMNGYNTGGTTITTEVIVSYVDKAVNPVAPYRRTVPLVLPVTATITKQRIGSQRRRLGR